MIELMPDGWLLLLDRLSRKLLEGGGHHIHIAPLEEDDVARRLFRSVLLECIVMLHFRRTITRPVSYYALFK